MKPAGLAPQEFHHQADSPGVPHAFGGYVVTQRLHDGARSVVERAVRAADNQVVIIKQAADGVVGPDRVRRIQHEFELLELVRGDGIVRAHTLLRDGARAGLVLEAFGERLTSVIAARRLGLLEVLDIGASIARALACVHAAGVIHKDVNPNNIVYDAASRAAKLIDFDIASRPTASSSFVAADALQGTLFYISPEQTGRFNHAVDARSDLYSLGATLYELLSGAPPFGGSDALAIVYAHLATSPRPLRELAPEVPPMVADIVGKLLAKAPDQRYQTAAGLAVDLERARHQLVERGEIAAFELAQSEATRPFGFSERLYGRESEIRVLLDAFARSSTGGVVSVLVAGGSGIGKSAMVREIYAPVTQRRGYFAAGKFEQLHRDTPFSALTQALDELLGQVLSAPDLGRWRMLIRDALGDVAALVCPLLPSLERVLGAPVRNTDPLPEAEVAQHRLQSALTRLFQAFSRTAHPLVLFIDDVQWADAASIQLLSRLVASDATGSLLLIEAYRDNELDPGHPYLQALAARERRGVTTFKIALTPLTAAETAELIADALQQPGGAGSVTHIAQLIWEKTGGNPFFIRQFMYSLHDAGLITFDPVARHFVLGASAIERAQITENVADLLARALARLPAITRGLLVTAAAIGNRFELSILAIIAKRPPDEIDRMLGPALAAGLITPAGAPAWIGDYFVEHERCGFVHSRIQRAAYDTLPAGERERLHLEIGRQLLSACTDVETSSLLFEIVDHLNLGRALIASEPERERFCALAITAAQRARRAGAFDVAAALYQAVCETRQWQAHYATMLAAHVGVIEALALAGAHHRALEVVHAALREASRRDRAMLEGLAATVQTAAGDVIEAVACVRRGMALLGIELPSDPAELARQIEIEIAAIMAAVEVKPIAEWIELPLMTDPDTLVAMTILAEAQLAAYQAEAPLTGLTFAKLVHLSLEHGNCAASARGYSSIAILFWTMGQYEIGYAFGRLGVELANKLGLSQMPSVNFNFAVFAAPWQRPLDECIELLRKTQVSAIDGGSATHAVYAALTVPMYRLMHGAPLAEVLDDGRAAIQLCMRLSPETASWMTWFMSHASWFLGGADPSNEFAAIERELCATRSSQSVLTNFRMLELERRYWRGEHRECLALAVSIVELASAIAGTVIIAELWLYRCLSALALGDISGPFEADRATLAGYAAACPHNFGHMSLLIDAELARYHGDTVNALALYDRALAAAAESGFVKVEIIGHELAARFWLERDKAAFAAIHLVRARDLCEQWGARPRARELELRRRNCAAPAELSSPTRATQNVASRIDLVAVVKASQAIADEVVLDRLFVKIMPIIVENAGAQAGAIVLETDGRLFLHAASAGHTVSATPGGAPLSEAGGASEGIVRYAIRTAEPVALDDAGRDPSFRSDPYVRARRPRSVLCVPILHSDRAVGAVYLENNLVAGAFTIERLQALGVLVSQLAISIENAQLFARLTRYRDHLEQLVAERTSALSAANQQLREQAAIRERMESELRLAQKLQSVGQLAAGVAHEINTPIQFVGDSITFIHQSIDSLISVIDARHAATDAATKRIDLDAVAAAEQTADLDYVREHVAQSCANAADGVERVTQIVRAMKTFSRPDQVSQTPTSINAALESTLVVARNEYRRVADIVTDFGELPQVTCHIGEINQVFLNLIVNAAHAIEHVVGGSSSRGTITIATRHDGDMVVITVTDSGSGIPRAIRDRVFDPFFTTKEVGKGTGQGLTLARAAVVDRHGGTIAFECPPGGGTTFTIRLPIAGRPPPPGSGAVSVEHGRAAS